jgi:hypothetical protein
MCLDEWDSATKRLWHCLVLILWVVHLRIAVVWLESVLEAERASRRKHRLQDTTNSQELECQVRGTVQYTSSNAAPSVAMQPIESCH